MIKQCLIILCLFAGGVSHASIGKLSPTADFNMNLKTPTVCAARAAAEKLEATNGQSPFRYDAQKTGARINQAKLELGTNQPRHNSK